MSVFVVDASLVVKWFVPEVHSEAARRWLGASHDYIAPDLVFPEVGNAIWKKTRRGELSEDEGQRLVADISAIGVEAVSMRALLPDAHALAIATGVTVYDATYL
ncbi:MAG: type II toxin-antitoxin system VapC family toxin, partial [Acidobacteria bacterium]|nr:type II toxin-antitoxin system VapC family toxin [Acidobacteriota bacterium]